MRPRARGTAAGPVEGGRGRCRRRWELRGCSSERPGMGGCGRGPWWPAGGRTPSRRLRGRGVRLDWLLQGRGGGGGAGYLQQEGESLEATARGAFPTCGPRVCGVCEARGLSGTWWGWGIFREEPPAEG